MNDEVQIIGADGEVSTSDVLQETHYFTTGIYQIQKPEFLAVARTVAYESLKKVKKEVDLNKIYPAYMSYSFADDPRLSDMVTYIGLSAGNILKTQGFDTNNSEVVFNEFWAQEHHQYSGQEEHIHPGQQISGFYFLDVPEDSSLITFHDPRPAKKMMNLAETNMNNITYASAAINFVPTPGLLMFSNSWLPHTFTKNGSKKSFRFIHFNLGVRYLVSMQPQQPVNQPEIV
jgi:uncharacterized protein (TIGR02466 family)